MINILAAQDTFFLIYIVVLLAAFYFILIRPQSKEKKKVQALLDSMEIGDSVLTTAGFYGVIIDITDEIVIVEFGNNRNCRIPMKKTSVIGVEKAGTHSSSASGDKTSSLGKEKK